LSRRTSGTGNKAIVKKAAAYLACLGGSASVIPQVEVSLIAIPFFIVFRLQRNRISNYCCGSPLVSRRVTKRLTFTTSESAFEVITTRVAARVEVTPSSI
jgi:hypothetical protein